MRLISVIIPVHNPQKHLLDCLASVFAQTRAAHEVIVVDDGSREEYAPFIADIQSLYPTLRLHTVRPNKGVAHARNLGARHATGDYLAFIDQDDLWIPQKIALQAGFLDENADIDYLTTRQRYFLSAGAADVPGWVKSEHMETSLPGFLPGTLMVRKAAFDKLGGFDEQLKAGTDDVDWFFRAATAGLKTYELPEETLLKRIHGENLSSKTSAHNKELLSVVRMNLQRRKGEAT